MLSPYLRSRLSYLLSSFERFPLIPLATIVAAWVLSDAGRPFSLELKAYVSVMLLITVLLEIILPPVVLHRYGRKHANLSQIIIALIIAAIGYLWYPSEPWSSIDSIYHAHIIWILLVASFLTPVWVGDKRSVELWRWVISEISVGILTVFVGLTGLFASLGVFASLRALLNLDAAEFDINISIWVALIAGMLALMTALPKLEDDRSSHFHGENWLARLGITIALPVAIAYGVILSVYGAKILITGEWPSNSVNFVAFGCLFAYLIAWGATYSRLHHLPKWFARVTGALMVVASILAITALIQRIDQYSFTSYRYAGLIGWTSVFAVATYVLFRGIHGLFLARLLMLTLSVMSVMLIGPWSLESLPLRMQAQRVVDLIEQSNITMEDLTNLELTTSKISPENAEQIIQAIQYIRVMSANRGIESLLDPALAAAIRNGLVNELTLKTPGFHPTGYVASEAEIMSGVSTQYLQFSAALDDDADRIKRLPNAISTSVNLDFIGTKIEYRLNDGVTVKWQDGTISVERPGKTTLSTQPLEYVRSNAASIIRDQRIPAENRYVELGEGIIVEMRSLFIGTEDDTLETLAPNEIHGSVTVYLP